MGQAILLKSPKSSYTSLQDLQTYRANAFFLKNNEQSFNGNQSRPPVLCVKRVNSEQTEVIKSERTVIYFHGNSEDLGTCFSFLLDISDSIGCDVYALEYPGYGMYQWKNDNKTKADQMKEDAEDLYEYLSKQQNFNPSQLIILGRSIGSGLACWLGKRTTEFQQTRQLAKWSGHLVLISPFTSIRNAIRKRIYGLCEAFEDFFDNETYLQDFPLPTLLIHGKKDSTIDYTQSVNLSKNLMYSLEHYPEEMDHNNFNFQKDIADTINMFLQTKLSKKTIPNDERNLELVLQNIYKQSQNYHQENQVLKHMNNEYYDETIPYYFCYM